MWLAELGHGHGKHSYMAKRRNSLHERIPSICRSMDDMEEVISPGKSDGLLVNYEGEWIIKGRIGMEWKICG